MEVYAKFLIVTLVSGVYYAHACQDRVYVGGPNGELAVSFDGGESWTNHVVKIGIGINSIVELDNGYVILGTTSGLYRSKNYGHSWTLTMNAYSFYFLNAVGSNVSVSYSYSSSWYVLKSNDSGGTWPGNYKFSAWTSDPSALYSKGSADYYGTSRDGLCYSSDNLVHYKCFDKSSGLAGNSVGAITFVGDTIYVGINDDGAPLSISDDNLATWSTAYIDPQRKNNGVGGLTYTNGQYFAIVNYYGVAVARDPYSTWSIMNTSNGLASNITTQLAASNTGCVYATSSAGLSISRDGGRTWIKKTIQDGLPTNNLLSVFAKSFETTTTIGLQTG